MHRFGGGGSSSGGGTDEIFLSTIGIVFIPVGILTVNQNWNLKYHNKNLCPLSFRHALAIRQADKFSHEKSQSPRASVCARFPSNENMAQVLSVARVRKTNGPKWLDQRDSLAPGRNPNENYEIKQQINFPVHTPSLGGESGLSEHLFTDTTALFLASPNWFWESLVDRKNTKGIPCMSLVVHLAIASNFWGL